MFLHAFPPTAPDASPPTSWWAVHVPSLTPIRVLAGPTTFMAECHPLSPPDPSYPPPAASDIARELATISPLPVTVRYKDTPPQTLSEYHIAFTAKGESPAIWRTQDPHLIIAAQSDHCLKDEFMASRSATDISGEGWAYWWEDAHLAYDELSPQFISTTSGK